MAELNKVEFRFRPGDEVVTRFGANGIVQGAAIFRGAQIMYEVLTADQDTWLQSEDIARRAPKADAPEE